MASTLLPKSTGEEDDEGSQAAPAGKEFKDGDCFLLVRGHHVLFCSSGISQSKAELYLHLLFRAAGLKDETDGFDLSPASNLKKLKLIQEHGVRSLELGTNAFLMSLSKPKRKTWIARTFGMMGDELKALVVKDQTAIEQRGLEDLLVNIEVRLNGNTRAADNAQRFIRDLASGLLDGDENSIDDYVIVTQNNERIRPGQIRLQTVIHVEKKGNSVSHNSVWSELRAYLEELGGDRLLEN